MSSNAFARSRPRIRHQRVPRAHGYVHPRFLQLVKELARLDEVKKKQEELGRDDSCGAVEGACSSGGGNCNAASSCGVSNSTGRSGDCSSSTTTTTITTDHQQPPHHLNQPSSTNNSDCCPSAQNLTSCSSGSSSCCGAANGAQASNGYRSLGCNQSTSATNDNYYRQNNNNNNHNQLNNYEQNYTNHHIHHNNNHHHHNHHHHQHSRGSNHLSNSNLHHQAHIHPPPPPPQRQDDRCLASKSSTPSSSSSSSAASLATPAPTTTFNSTTTLTTNLGHLKQGPLEQNNSDFSNINLDLRQDENRSKRKRASNDPSSSSKKLSAASSSSCGTLSKRQKSSPEPIRPLSPSFTKCPICLLDCMDRDPSFTNTCFHIFCFVCIENWTKNKATCPLCRTKFTKIIYNIRSASCYDEKVASPIRRDDDDERVIIYEQLQGLNTNQMVPNRGGSNVDETQPAFDNLRVNDVLMPPFTLYNQIDHRQDSLRSFNTTTTTTTNFNSSVPHHPLFNYNPTASNYLLIPSVGLSPRVQQQLANTHDALSSAYAVNSGLANGGSDPSRASRVPRNGRYIYPRNYDLQTIDNPGRVSRTSGGGSISGGGSSGAAGGGGGAAGDSTSGGAGSGGINPTGLPLDRQIHHNQHPHSNHHHHSQHGLHGQHRSSATLDMGATRQSQRMDHSHIHMAHSNMPRYYNPSVYSRRPYTNPPIDQHILDNLYRQMPDI